VGDHAINEFPNAPAMSDDSPRVTVILADGPAECLNLRVAFAMASPPPRLMCEIPTYAPCRCGDPHCKVGGSSRVAVAWYSRGVGVDGLPILQDGLSAYFFDGWRL
jgi:hypothetical protein